MRLVLNIAVKNKITFREKSMRCNFTIFADYFQFFLEDESMRRPVEIDWNSQSVSDLLVAGQRFIAISTVRNMRVPVIIEVYNSRPSPNFDQVIFQQADHVVEASIEIISGNLVILGTTDYYPDAPRISVAPDTYQARVYYVGLNTLSEDGLEGNDSYRIVLFPGNQIAVKVLKRGNYLES